MFTFSPAAASNKKSTDSSSSNTITNPLLGQRPVVSALRDVSNDGLRQRHRSVGFHDDQQQQPSTSTTLAVQQQKKQPRKSSAPPPPRGSYSLGTANGMLSSTPSSSRPLESSQPVGLRTNENVDTTTTTTTPSMHLSKERALVPSTTGSWVLIWGFTTQQQYQRTLQHFSSLGHVIDQRGGGGTNCDNNNWMALQYENRLLAEKAICHSGCALPNSGGGGGGGNIFLGVKHLNDDDKIVLQQHNQWRSSATDASSNHLFNTSTEQQQSQHQTASSSSSDQDFIMLSGSSRTDAQEDRKKDSMCVQFIKYLLLIRD